MSAGTGQAGGPAPGRVAPAGTGGSGGAGGAGAAAEAAGQEGTWHHRIVELADGWPWIRTLNDQLTASIGRCRFLLNDCRSKLAANSNDKQAAGPADDDEIQQRTS